MLSSAAAAPASVTLRARPPEARFAFTILDDTDDATTENVRPLYDLLFELGFRTTKTVWPEPCPEGSDIYFAGDTLANPDYRRFCLELQERGFELTWHCATMESSERSRSIQGLRTFRDLFGHYPAIHVNHGQNAENLYWGHNRYHTTAMRALARVLKPRRRGETTFEGEREGSPYFWGDLCRAHMKYVRNLTFCQLNTIRADPFMPYRLDDTPWVNYWFSTSDAPDAAAFLRLVTPENVQRLADEGGVCILSTHLGKGFVRNGRVEPGVERALRHIAELPGWFAPVSSILDDLHARNQQGAPSRLALTRLELRHAIDRVRSTS